MAAARALAGRMDWLPDQLTALCDDVVREWQEWSRILPVDAYALPNLNDVAMPEAPVPSPQVVELPAANDAPDPRRCGRW
jgi:two-component system cell cycle response regulator